ncbi:MAG: glutamate--tRNA ligase [Propionibacteriaceae bacterium]|nr:glutamate--tRNA ligase [Propionibacteriaceae bacterium]
MTEPTQTVPARTRVAPSPTGDPHVGTAYQALFDVAWARKTGGRFVLRIEDTDRARTVEGSEQLIYSDLAWLGLAPDEGPQNPGECGPYRQSERLPLYRQYAEQLIEQGHAYYCWCSPERLAQLRADQAASKTSQTGYDRCCLGLTRDERAKLPGFSPDPVVRMLVPDDVDLEFTDAIRGQVHTPRPDDQVILKADGFPTYHLAVVVDDHLMGITAAVRGEEWISSTPKHLLLYKWLGWTPPAIAHMPLLRNTDKSKISKRKNPAARLEWFREAGYLPEALLNFLELLAYPPVHPDTEVQSFDEFVACFDWAKVNTTGPIFDLAKLNWLNGAYLRQLSDDELAHRIVTYWEQTGEPGAADPRARAVVAQAAPIIRERLTTLADAAPMIGFLLTPDAALGMDDDALATLPPNADQVLDAAQEVLAGLDDFRADAIQAGLRTALVDGLGLKPKVAFGPVRVALTGRRVSPPLFESAEILGRASCLARLGALRARLSA